MKVLDTSFESPTSSQPMKQGSMNLIQQAWQEVTTSLALNIIGNGYDPTIVYILYGCINSGSGSNYIISSGAVFYSGEVYQVPATTFTAAGGQTAVGAVVTNFIVAANADPVVFTDGTSHNVHQNRIITIASAVSGSGTADFSLWANREDIWQATTTTSGNVLITGPSTSSLSLQYSYHTIGNTTFANVYFSFTTSGTSTALVVKIRQINATLYDSTFLVGAVTSACLLNSTSGLTYAMIGIPTYNDFGTNIRQWNFQAGTTSFPAGNYVIGFTAQYKSS